MFDCVVFFFFNFFIQLENEKASLSGEKQSLEQEKFGIKEELVRVEQEKMDLDTEKMCKPYLPITFQIISFTTYTFCYVIDCAAKCRSGNDL